MCRALWHEMLGGWQLTCAHIVWCHIHNMLRCQQHQILTFCARSFLVWVACVSILHHPLPPSALRPDSQTHLSRPSHPLPPTSPIIQYAWYEPLKDWYAAYNKPGAVVDYFEHNNPSEEWVVILGGLIVEACGKEWARE